MKKTILFVAAGGVFILTGIAGAIGITNVVAAVSNGEYPLIIQNLAKKFNATEAEVETVFEETRDQRTSERLDHAVANGEITSAQKELILKKQEEIEAKIKEIDNQKLTSSERQETMQKLMTELKTWAETNDIPYRLLMQFRRGGKMDGGMRPGMRGMNGEGMGQGI